MKMSCYLLKGMCSFLNHLHLIKMPPALNVVGYNELTRNAKSVVVVVAFFFFFLGGGGGGPQSFVQLYTVC